MPAVIMWFARMVPWFLSSVVGDNVLRFAAGKVLLGSLFMVVLPLILNNFVFDLMNMVTTMVAGNASGVNFDGSMSFTGLTAHFIRLLKLSECMSVLVSAIVVKFSLSMIPFVRV